MAGNCRARKSWDTLSCGCGGAAVARNKKILRGHMIVLLAAIIARLVWNNTQNPRWERLMQTEQKRGGVICMLSPLRRTLMGFNRREWQASLIVIRSKLAIE